MVEALSSWSTWAALLGGWLVASIGSAFVLAKFFRRAQGKHERSAAAGHNEVSEESARTSVPPGFFADFVDEPTRANLGSKAEAGAVAVEEIFDTSVIPHVEAATPRLSGTRFKAIEKAAPATRKQA